MEHNISMPELIETIVKTIPAYEYNNQMTPEENAYNYWKAWWTSQMRSEYPW